MTEANLPIKLVAIDGHGGSGKSTPATLIANQLQAQIIHTDDFAGRDNPHISCGVFVDAPLAVCLQRGYERDNPKEYADLVLDGTKPFEGRIDYTRFGL